MSSPSELRNSSITMDDLPHIKKILSVILTPETQSVTRLEIFARMAGFRTYAGLKSRLENFTDIGGKSFPLDITQGPSADPDFFNGLADATKRSIIRAEEVGFIRLIIAGLRNAQHSLIGAVGIPDSLTIDALERTALNVFHPTTQSQPARKARSSFDERPAIVVSRSNMENALEMLGMPAQSLPPFAVFRPLMRPEDSFYCEVEQSQILEIQTPADLRHALSDRTVFAFSTDDLLAMRAYMRAPAMCVRSEWHNVKPIISEIFGATYSTEFADLANDMIVIDDEDRLKRPSMIAIEYLVEMVITSRIYKDEMSRLGLKA